MTRALFFFVFSAYAGCSSIPAGLGNRPLAFESNRGQAAPTVRFVALGNSHDYLLTGSRVTVLGASLSFPGANAEPQALPLDQLAERHNYFHGPVSQRDIPTYRRVRYSSLHPGIVVFSMVIRNAWNSISKCLPARTRIRSACDGAMPSGCVWIQTGSW